MKENRLPREIVEVFIPTFGCAGKAKYGEGGIHAFERSKLSGFMFLNTSRKLGEGIYSRIETRGARARAWIHAFEREMPEGCDEFTLLFTYTLKLRKLSSFQSGLAQTLLCEYGRLKMSQISNTLDPSVSPSTLYPLSRFIYPHLSTFPHPTHQTPTIQKNTKMQDTPLSLLSTLLTLLTFLLFLLTSQPNVLHLDLLRLTRNIYPRHWHSNHESTIKLYFILFFRSSMSKGFWGWGRE